MCAFASGGAKSQRLRHNIPEISAWGPLQRHHVHAETEWTPVQIDGVIINPSAEEAEYSAKLAFSIAISVSWWAARMGYAIVVIPRLAQVETVGKRSHWLDVDPRRALAPLAISLGLLPRHPEKAPRVPLRGRVSDLLSDGSLPEGCVYVGQHHHSPLTSSQEVGFTLHPRARRPVG